MTFTFYSHFPYPQLVIHPPTPPPSRPQLGAVNMQHNHASSSRSMQPPPSPNVPIDPALALYSPYYPYQQLQQQPQGHGLHLPQNHVSSPSSNGSEMLGTPDMDNSMSLPNANGKRPPLPHNASSGASGSRKKSRQDDDDDVTSTGNSETKAKATRGSRACTVCRRLKMKCIGAEDGPPCKRCKAGHHECIFEESNRGKRSSKKHELLTRSLRKMEKTLDTVLKSIGNPTIASGMVSRSPSPTSQTMATQTLLASPSPPPPAELPIPSRRQPNKGASPKLHSLPDDSLNPLGLLAEASLANRRATQAGAQHTTDGRETPQMGVASELYFKPGPMTILPLRRLYIERQVQPEMLSFVSTDEVVELFEIFFDRLNVHSALLDRDFHTPSLVCSRSPFLLTTVCAIASRFYSKRAELHARLTELAKDLAFDVPSKGYKSVEIVQAYLILTLWGCGAVERFEQDKTWLLLGMALRMATDLNLHRKTAVRSTDTPEGRARDREVHNRERTWLLCFGLDRSFSAQMGKPFTIREDFIIRNINQWVRSPSATASDVGLAGYLELQRVMSRNLEFLYSGSSTPSGLQTDCDFLVVIKSMEQQVENVRNTWQQRAQQSHHEPDVAKYRQHIGAFYYYYSLLVLHSFGLHDALQRTPINTSYFFHRTHSSATACATIVRDRLGPSGSLKYAPDSHFVQIAYAVLSLLKLVRPELQTYLPNEQHTLNLVKDVVDVLERVAVNQHHTPALYSSFLRALLNAKEGNHTLSSGNGGHSNPAHANSSGSSHLRSNIGASDPFISGHNGSEVPVLNEFSFESEMGPVADMSTFPPTMAAHSSMEDNSSGMMNMDDILPNGFWNNVLMPGYSNGLEGLSGGMVFGTGGSGLITPHMGQTPDGSGANTPARGQQHTTELTQQSISAAFDNGGMHKEGQLP